MVFRLAYIFSSKPPRSGSSSSSSSSSSGSSSNPKSSLKFDTRLTGKSSFDHWLYQLGNWAYGKGKVYDDNVRAGTQQPNQDPNPDGQDFNTDERRSMWATVILTLDSEEVQKVRSVRRGCVEKLIRAIVKMYDEKSEINLDTMRKKIQTCKLQCFRPGWFRRPRRVLRPARGVPQGLRELQGEAHPGKHALPHAGWPAVRVRAR